MSLPFDIDKLIAEANTIGISGHIRPDGDAVGSCLGMYLFIRRIWPEKQVRVLLDSVPAAYRFLKGADEVCTEPDKNEVFDLFIALDCSDPARLGDNGIFMKTAKVTVCIDHHVTNSMTAMHCFIVPDASSTCELVCDILGMERIDHDMAEALYMGIAHDTGVFQYSCTSSHTMNLAGMLMDKGIDHSRIITKSYYEKTYLQQQILGKALLESIRMLDGQVIFSVIRMKDMAFFCASSEDLEGIVALLRDTQGVEAAIFLYEVKPGEWKVSLRSTDKVDVAKIASFFKGGGHVRAAGCTMQGDAHDVVNNIVEHVAAQLENS